MWIGLFGMMSWREEKRRDPLWRPKNDVLVFLDGITRGSLFSDFFFYFGWGFIFLLLLFLFPSFISSFSPSFLPLFFHFKKSCFLINLEKHFRAY